MKIDMTKPKKLYRYSERKWLEQSLEFGEFRLRPASDYKQQETDAARNDDELVRFNRSPAASVSINNLNTGQAIKPICDVVYTTEVGTNYLTLCFSERWDEQLFEDFPDTDACLIIHKVEDFCERLHRAAEIALPHWSGIDAAVIYGGISGLGAIFSKPLQFIPQHEWRFAWQPRERVVDISPFQLTIGSIADIAEIVDRPACKAPLPR